MYALASIGTLPFLCTKRACDLMHTMKWYQGLIDSFGEEGMQLPISILQQSWQPATVRRKNGWGFSNLTVTRD